MQGYSPTCFTLFSPHTSTQHIIFNQISFFISSDHQNWFGIDEHLGAVAISVRRERATPPSAPTHPAVGSTLSSIPHSNNNNSSSPSSIGSGSGIGSNGVGNNNNPPFVSSSSSASFSSMDNLSSSLEPVGVVGVSPPGFLGDKFVYRLMIRSSELLPLRGVIPEECIPTLKSEKIKTLPTKEVLEFVCPELQLSR